MVVLGLTVLGLGYLWFTAPPDPIYDGMRLSEHLKIHYGRGASLGRRGQKLTQEEMDRFQAQWERSRVVVHNLDERSIPLLRNWMKRPRPQWADQAATLMGRAGFSPFWVHFDQQYAACETILWNGKDCTSLLPEVRACFNSPDARIRAMALGAFSTMIETPEARAALMKESSFSIPELLGKLRGGTAEDAFYAAGFLWAVCKENALPEGEDILRELLEISRQRVQEEFPSARPLVLPISMQFAQFKGSYRAGSLKTSTYLYRTVMLIDPDWRHRHLITLEFGPEADRVGAAWALGNETFAPEKAVPLLVANLSSTNRALVENCAIALGKYGPPAAPALPVLTNLLAHPKLAIRSAVSNAVTEIGSPSATVPSM